MQVGTRKYIKVSELKLCIFISILIRRKRQREGKASRSSRHFRTKEQKGTINVVFQSRFPSRYTRRTIPINRRIGNVEKEERGKEVGEYIIPRMEKLIREWIWIHSMLVILCSRQNEVVQVNLSARNLFDDGRNVCGIARDVATFFNFLHFNGIYECMYFTRTYAYLELVFHVGIHTYIYTPIYIIEKYLEILQARRKFVICIKYLES